MYKINFSEFKAVYFRLLEKIRSVIAPIEVIKKEESSVDFLCQPTQKKRKEGQGAMKQTLVGEVGDLITPIEIFHRKYLSERFDEI